MSISFTAINQKGNEERRIACNSKDKISQLKETLKFAKLNKFVFTKFDGQLIDENQLCEELKDQVIYVVADVAKRINIRIFPEDEFNTEIVLEIKLSSTTRMLKEWILTKNWRSKPEGLTENNIEIKCGGNVLKDDDYIFCQNNDSDCFDLYIHVDDIKGKNDDKDDEGKKPLAEKRKSARKFKPKIVEPPRKYYFISFNGKPLELVLDSSQTFSQINEMEELKSHDLTFFFNDDIINLDSKISDYKGAQKRSTPIHIQINYLIHVIYEGSEKAPKEYHHPFSSEQTVGDVLQLYAKDDKNRGELKYENKRIEPETKLSKIDYRKEEPLLVLIHPSNKDNADSKNIFIGEDDEKFHIIVDRIGEGSTAVTFKIFDFRTNRTMCKKVIKFDHKKTFKDLQNAIKEFEFLYSIHHPCICIAYGINTCEVIKNEMNKEMTTVAIFLEHLEYSLSECLEKNILNNTIKSKIVVEICHGMSHIHKIGWIHRDLKIDNIMLNSLFQAKIVDFGLVRFNEFLDESYSLTKCSMSKGVGTISYMSPEMMNEEEYDNKTDVYSFGIVLYFLFVGSLPDYKIRDKMMGKPIPLPKASDSISKLCLSIISLCTYADPSDRPSFDKILDILRKNNYQLASNVDMEFVKKRDIEIISSY